MGVNYRERESSWERQQKVLLRGMGNAVQYPGVNRNGKDKEKQESDFPGGPGVENPPANAGDAASIPGPGRSYTPQGA